MISVTLSITINSIFQSVTDFTCTKFFNQFCNVFDSTWSQIFVNNSSFISALESLFCSSETFTSSTFFGSTFSTGSDFFSTTSFVLEGAFDGIITGTSASQETSLFNTIL
ncbi:hypothetical protein J5751_06455 [bacterium]|nr:hypothetical protein [bacterium]